MNHATDFSDIEKAIEAIAAGQPIVAVDNEDRENEGDLIIAAQLATPKTMGFLVRYTSGLICAPLPEERAAFLQLPLMVTDSQDPKRTAYTISCDARLGTTTGISAHDRALTVHALADPSAGPDALQRPGHVLPLIARPGGVLERGGHTEAAVDLCRLAGLEPVGAIGEVVHDEGSMMRLPDLRVFCANHGLQLITIDRLAAYRRYLNDQIPIGTVDSSAQAATQLSASDPVRLPTDHGEFQAIGWRNGAVEHISLTSPGTVPNPVPLVRVHSECLTGDVFGSYRCDCGDQLSASLKMVHEQGGAVIYLRNHEGRGIGLVNKMRAYALQQAGADTIEANELLGLPADARNYHDAAQILHQLGLHRIRLVTNNPDKVSALRNEGIDVVEVVPVEIGARPENLRYLRTKRDRMHHVLNHLA